MCAGFFLPGTKAQLDEGGGRILLGDSTGGKAVMLQLTRLQYFGIRISTGIPCVHKRTYLTIRISSLDVCKIRPTQGIPE